MQFSIRHLIILTATVCVVVMIGTYLRGTLATMRGTSATSSNVMNVVLFTLFYFPLMLISPVVMSLLAVWSTITLARPTFRIVTAVVLSLFIGLVQQIVFIFIIFQARQSFNVMSSLYTAGVMLVVIISLLVFRQCGYRVSRERNAVARD